MVPRDRIELSTPAFSGRGAANGKTRGKGQAAVHADAFRRGGPAKPAHYTRYSYVRKSYISPDEPEQGRVGHA